MFESAKKQRHYIFFIAVSFIFLVISSELYPLNMLSTHGDIFGLASAVLFVAYAFFYLTGKESRKMMLDLIFAISLLNLICMFIFTGPISSVIWNGTVNNLYIVAISGLIIILISFPLFLGAHLFRDKKLVLIGCILFAVVIAIVAYYFLSGVFIKYYIIDDEFFISMNDIKFLLEGLNPYTYSIGQQVYYNSSILGFSFTTSGQVAGTLSYPALYLFSYLPFYFAASPTIYNMEHYTAPLQSAFLFTILLFVIAFSIDKKYLKSPIYGLLVFLAFIFMYVGSITVYLMLALLILAYKYTGTKYSWILFGLCLAIQELIWIPVILLFAYSINNYGWKKGIYDIIGAITVFLIINSYFIAIGPSAFFSALFNPLQQSLLPIGNGYFGFLILAGYHTLLSTYTAIFGIVTLLVVIAYLYTNEKALAGLFGMIPFLFLARSLTYYYALFVTFLVVTMFISERRKKNASVGLLGKYLRKRKDVAALSVLVLVALLLLILYSSHASYSRAFNLKVSNQSIYYNATSNETVYTGRLEYSSLQTKNVYIMFFASSDGKFQRIGIANQSIISDSVICGTNDISCLVNVNRITLDNSTGNYTIKAYLGRTNMTESIKDARLYIYYNNYFYIADSVSNTIK